MMKVQNELRAYLFGGLSRDLHCSIAYVAADSSKYGFKWKLDSAGDSSKKRYGHAATTYDDQLVIMGGAKMYNREAKQRECLNDVLIYNPIREEYTEIIPEGIPCEPRRYHSACMIGSQLLIYGGINGKQAFLSDLMALNISKYDKHSEFVKAWRWIPVFAKGHKPGNLANHTCQLVLHPDRYRTPGLISLTMLPECRGGKPKIEYEGMYIFGGRDEKGPKNKLCILKVGQKQSEWLEPNVDGRPPLARYGHTMNYYPDKNIFIVFGGRNDDNFASTGQAYLNDVWILYLEKLRWIHWDKDSYGGVPSPRYSQCSVTLGTSIVFFGGLDEDNYCKADLHTIEMEEGAQRFKERQIARLQSMRAYAIDNRYTDKMEESKDKYEIPKKLQEADTPKKDLIEMKNMLSELVDEK